MIELSPVPTDKVVLLIERKWLIDRLNEATVMLKRLEYVPEVVTCEPEFTTFEDQCPECGMSEPNHEDGCKMMAFLVTVGEAEYG